MNRIVTISFTPLDAPGGVPKFNRDLHAAFPGRECVHFSWWDFPWCIEMEHLTEWEKARTLNHYLVASRKLLPTDVVIADGFWADGLQHMKLAVSHSHGIWSHLTKEDVDAGKTPDMPYHHAAQVSFRQRWAELGKHLTAVSDFIANELDRQWGLKVDRVISNGVDRSVFKPSSRDSGLNDLLVVHGVNDKGNSNKGWDHIELLKKSIPSAHILSLDETQHLLGRNGEEWTKAEALAMADIFVHPSGYEGNSMMVAEAMSCGLPIVAYDVGYLFTFRQGEQNSCGRIIDRKLRSPQKTLEAFTEVLNMTSAEIEECSSWSRNMAPSWKEFAYCWNEYVEEIEHGA